MKAVPECIPCVLKIAVETVERAVPEDSKKEAILTATERVAELYSREPTPQPPRLGTEAQLKVMEYAEDPDPYKEDKEIANERALELAEELESDIENLDVDEKLKRAVVAAIAGNVIDFAVAEHEFNLDDLKYEIQETEPRVYDIDPEELKDAKVVYLCDNAGEIALDRVLIKVLIEDLDADVTAVVRGEPIVNDATIEDAKAVGLTEVCEVKDTGGPMLGLLLDDTSEEFRNLLESADVVVSKGQGNFESIPDEPFPDVPVYFLLRAKCGPVAEELNVSVGDYVAKRWEPGPDNVERWRGMMNEEPCGHG